MRIWNLAIVASFMSITLPTLARANTITYTGYSVLNDQNVTLNDATLAVSNEQGGSGEVSFSGVTGVDGTLSTWCVDIQDYLQSSGSFTTGTFINGAVGNAINALITNVSPTLGTTFDASAALQVAIWEVEYGSDLNVSAPTNVTSLADQYLADVNDATWTADPTMTVAVLSGGGVNQDQAYLTPVPEPVSLTLLGSALLGTAAGQRWRSFRRLC